MQVHMLIRRETTRHSISEHIKNMPTKHLFYEYNKAIEKVNEFNQGYFDQNQAYDNEKQVGSVKVEYFVDSIEVV